MKNAVIFSGAIEETVPVIRKKKKGERHCRKWDSLDTDRACCIPSGEYREFVPAVQSVIGTGGFTSE